MTKPMIRILNLETQELTDREMTDKEFSAYQAQKAADELAVEKEAEAAAKRQALLDKLGITKDEARLLLGGN